MRRAAAFGICLLVVALSVPTSAAQATRSDAFVTEVKRVVPGLLGRYEVPSAALAVVERSRVTWTDRFDGKGVVRRGDVFRVASLSKTATALAVLSLAERGELDLDAPIDRYMKRWHVPTSSFDESRVTPRAVLTHTAGFPMSGRGASGAPRYPPVEDILNGRHGLAPARLEFEPGSRFRYSNPGYVVLELLVEEVTGREFSDAMRALVLEPLEMPDSGYEDNGALVARDVQGFVRTGEIAGRQRHVPRGPGGLLSTPRDIARLLVGTWLPKDEGGLLRADTLEEMRTLPKASVGAFGLGDDSGYALGIGVAKLPSGKTSVMNNGSFEGYNAMILGIAEEESGVVVLTNSNTGLGAELELLLDWFDRVAGERPGFAGRLATIRTAMRYGTIAALLLSLAYLGLVARRVRHRRRAWPGRIRLRALLLKTIPLLVVAVALFLALGTGLITNALGGIAPARFISGDYQWLLGGLTLALFAIGAAATGLPKVREP